MRRWFRFARRAGDGRQKVYGQGEAQKDGLNVRRLHISRFSSVDYLFGTEIGAPLSLIMNTRNFAGLVLLALRPTV